MRLKIIYRRRLLVLSCTVLLLAAMIVPAFAAEDPGTVSSAYAFDTLTTISDGSIQDVICWIPRTGGYTASDAYLEYDTGTSAIFISSAYRNNYIRGMVSSGWEVDEFLLSAHSMLWQPSKTLLLEVEDTYDFSFRRVIVSFDAAYLTLNSTTDSYQVDYRHIEYDTKDYPMGFVPGSTLDLGFIFSNACRKNEWNVSSSGVYLLRNVSVEIQVDSTQGFSIYYQSDISDSVSDPYAAWINRQNLSAQVVDPDADLFSWLVRSADAFFELEVFPGFSLNTFIRFVVVCGLVLIFIKLFT